MDAIQVILRLHQHRAWENRNLLAAAKLLSPFGLKHCLEMKMHLLSTRRHRLSIC